MADTFRTIGLIGKPQHGGASQTLAALCDFLCQRGLKVVVDERVAADLPQINVTRMELMALGASVDLVIVVGGDGFMLGAARVLSRFGVPVVAIATVAVLSRRAPLAISQATASLVNP